MRAKIPQETRESQVKELIKDTTLVFIGWNTEYTNNKSLLIIKCSTCEYSWTPRLNDFLLSKVKCASCAGGRPTWTKTARESQINKICSAEALSFLGWESEYTDSGSRIIVKCSQGHSWDVSITNFINHGTRCPCCCNNFSFKSDSPASFYIQKLVFEDKEYIKFGITGREVKRRMSEQASKSKCEHILLHDFKLDVGYKAMELEKLVKQSLNTGVLSSDIMPDGFTETCSILDLPKILEIVKGYING